MNTSFTPKLAGELNRLAILNKIRLDGDISRADLKRDLGLSFPTISANVKILLDENYIVETTEGNNALGRKSTLLSFNKNRSFIVSIDIGRSVTRGAIANLNGDILHYELVSTEDDESKLTASTLDLIEKLIINSKVNKDDIIFIIIGTPGVINKDGFIELAPRLPLFSINKLCDVLKILYKSHVVVENSVKLGAIGELKKNTNGPFTNSVFINYGIGVGAALILNNSLYKGTHGCAGEIGFLLTSYQNKLPIFSHVGSFERTVTAIQSNLEGKDINSYIKKLILQYHQQDSKAVANVNKIKEAFSVAMVNIASILDIDVIIISGGLGISLLKEFKEYFEDILKAHVPYCPKIIFSELENKEGIWGGIYYAIDKIYSDPQNAFSSLI